MNSIGFVSLECSHFIQPTRGKEVRVLGPHGVPPHPCPPQCFLFLRRPCHPTSVLTPALLRPQSSCYTSPDHPFLPLPAEPTSAPNSRSHLGPHLTVHLCWTRGTLLCLPRKTASPSDNHCVHNRDTYSRHILCARHCSRHFLA